MTNKVREEDRFEFGKNWADFNGGVNNKRIFEAEKSLKQMLEINDLKGKSFLDIGSGSGLFSLAARSLGARVYSFDYDPESVACTKELKKRYFPDDSNWEIEKGDVLNGDYLRLLGQFDVVYSWGVLHHTGNMWKALENAMQPVMPGGKLFIAIYNNQGKASSHWKWVKKLYNSTPASLRFLIIWTAFGRLWGPALVRDLIQGRPLYSWKNYINDRGMSPWVDVVDWVGGYPFEVAKPEEIFDFYRGRGFILMKLKTCAGGLGCNEFIFERR